MADYVKYEIGGLIALVPKYDQPPRYIRKVGRFAVLANISPSAFAIGVTVQFLRAGVCLFIGPFWIGICHIERQQKAFEEWQPSTTPATDGRA